MVSFKQERKKTKSWSRFALILSIYELFNSSISTIHIVLKNVLLGNYPYQSIFFFNYICFLMEHKFCVVIFSLNIIIL